MEVTLEDLRRELKMFAEDTMRKELQALARGMVQELRSSELPVSTSASSDVEAAPLPMTRMAAEAMHCAPEQSYQELQEHVGDIKQARAVSSPTRQGTQLKSSHRWLYNVVRSTPFEVFSAGLVVLNSLWIGIATDWIARRWTAEVPGYFHVIDDSFCVLAVVELMFRFIAAGFDSFCSEHIRWNLFDTVVVTTQVVDMALTHLARHLHKHHRRGILSVFRVVKLARILRIARVASAFPQLHVLIKSIADSFANLFWTMVLVFSFNYAAAILITEVVSEYKIENGRDSILEDSEEMEDLYGNISRTMVSLFMIISGGISWIDLMHPLSENITPLFRYFFVPFTGFQIFGMMNVITACFLDNALRIAAATEFKDTRDSMWKMFSAVPGDDGGVADSKLTVTAKDFETNFSQPEMRKFLDAVHAKEGIDAEQLFKMMDKNGDGSLNINEFVATCDHITGPAKGFALAAFAKDHASFAKEQRNMILDLSQVQQQQHDEIMRHVSTLGEAVKNGRGAT